MAATAASITKHQLMKDYNQYCVKSVYIRSYSGPHFLRNIVQMRENVDQNNSENGHFLRSAGNK